MSAAALNGGPRVIYKISNLCLQREFTEDARFTALLLSASWG